MFTNTIKIATLENHQQVEKLLVGKMKSIGSMQDYVDMLKAFYSFFGGLEQIIKPFITPENIGDYDQRRKSADIASDIIVLGGVVPAVADMGELPVINNSLQAFGALYVIEGSTLGGKIITGMMQKYLNFDNRKGLSFFIGYGDNSIPMWEKFKQALNHIAVGDSDEAAIAYTANQTFEKFARWLEK